MSTSTGTSIISYISSLVTHMPPVLITLLLYDRDTSQGALKKIQNLRGFYIKSGQLAAANVGDGLYVSPATAADYLCI